MKKALHLLESLKHGGAENVALNYAKVLTQLGIESIMVALPHSAEYAALLAAEEIQTQPLLTKELIQSADYIFIHSNKNLLKLIPYLYQIKRAHIRVLYIQHLRYGGWKFRILAQLINWLCTDFIRITPVTQKLVDRYIRIPKHFVVNFYLPHYVLSEYPSIRKKVRNELGISQEQTLILFSAVFKPGKGLGDFIALAERCRNNDRYHFLVVGDGPERALVKEYKGSNLQWTGFVNDVEQYIIASDVYCFPSIYQQEMLPMALIEAIDCNKSILAFDLPINRFLLQEKVCHDINDMYQHIVNHDTPAGFTHYDEAYALNTLQKIL